MAHSDGATHDVESADIDVQKAHVGDGCNSECFVQLEVFDLAELQSSLLKQLLDGLGGGNGEIDGFDCGEAKIDYSGHGLEVVFLESLFVHQDQSAPCVVDLRGIGSSDHSVLLESGLELGNLGWVISLVFLVLVHLKGALV